MKNIPLADRPREKLLTNNAENLSEAELLAILLGTGKRGQSVLSVSETILKKFPFKKLSQITIKELVAIPGVGRSKAARIYAALELGERLYAPASLTKAVLRSTQDVLVHVREIVDKKQEYLLVCYLNARYELLQKEVVGVGSLNHMMITPKEIFGNALKTPCAAIIVAHNHPSGDPAPSDDDIHFTRRIHEAGEVMGIPLLDHLIVASSGYFSFKDNKQG